MYYVSPSFEKASVEKLVEAYKETHNPDVHDEGLPPSSPWE